MYSQEPIRQWRILKYRQLKGPDQEEKTDALLILDTTQKQMAVCRNGREEEKFYYDRTGKQSPRLKLKGMSVYVVMNSNFEGFRMTFSSEVREEFLSIMKEYVKFSAGSQPSSAQKQPAVREDFKPRAVSMPPPRSSAARNLAGSYFEPVHNPYAPPPPRISSSQPIENPYAHFPHGSSSQPIHNPYAYEPHSQPACNPYNATPPIAIPSSQYTTSYAEDPFATFESYTKSTTSSPAGSIPSTVGSIHSQHSIYSPLPFNNFSQPESLFSTSPHLTPLQPATPPAHLTPTGLPKLADSSVQTDDLIDQMIGNPTFMAACLRNLMENQTFAKLVTSTRAEIRSMKEEERNELYKNTDSRSTERTEETQPSLPFSSQPPSVAHHGASDLE